MAAPIRYYLDENLPVAVATQLRRRGIDAVTVRDLGLLGDSDYNHLGRATRLGYVFCTNDADFVELAKVGATHAGIVWSAAQAWYRRVGAFSGTAGICH